MDTLGLGIGHCRQPDAPRSKCVAEEWWGWGSTYGARVLLLPQRPLSAGPGPALACATTPYLAAEGQAQAPELPSGERERLGGRQHEYAHTQALALRALCPLSGGREPACEDASPECAPRAAAGECARSPSYMSSMCCASCAGRAGATAEAAAGAEWACVAGATISADAVERALAAVRERRPGAKR